MTQDNVSFIESLRVERDQQQTEEESILAGIRKDIERMAKYGPTYTTFSLEDLLFRISNAKGERIVQLNNATPDYFNNAVIGIFDRGVNRIISFLKQEGFEVSIAIGADNSPYILVKW